MNECNAYSIIITTQITPTLHFYTHTHTHTHTHKQNMHHTVYPLL